MARPRGRPLAVKSAGTREIILISIFLVAITWLVFGRTIGCDFVNYDDHVYVYRNPIITNGVTLHGIAWAFGHAHAGNWHPVTTLSHMLDCTIFDLKGGGHHFTNVLLHTLSVLLLFFALREMTGGADRTGNVWRSAFVAAVFAVHPLHVESVAWVAERKDVLSAVFFMLTLMAYTFYVRERSIGRYLLVLFFFACGLMSKSMLVTVPLVLLLLDYWPLGRSRRSDFRGHAFAQLRCGRQKSEIRSQRSGFSTATSHSPLSPSQGERIKVRGFDRVVTRKLVVEKIPLFALSVICAFITFFIQQRSPGSLEQLPLAWRINNALVSIVIYIRQMFWPVRLTVFYPHPENHLAFWQVALAAGFLIAITVLVILTRRTRPYLAVGWFWYLVMLVPVIGIVQVGLQGHADRYTYLPQIGLYLALTWLVAELLSSVRYRTTILAGASAIVLTALSACAWHQTSYWRNSEALWTRALAVTNDNETAHTNFGMLLLNEEKVDEAISHFETALQIVSRSGQEHYSLTRAIIHCDLASAFVRKGLIDDALSHLQSAVALQPKYADAHYNLGSVLLQKGELDQAIAQWQTVLSINPNDAGAHTALGNVLLEKGQVREAIAHYQAAIETDPVPILPLNNLAWILSTFDDVDIRNGRRAVELAQRAVELSRTENPVFIRTLAAAYAASGRFNEAIETAERALRLAQEQNQSDLEYALKKEIGLYRANLALHDRTQSPP
jgi:tetratricopeptide (TPR) repeat protein